MLRFRPWIRIPSRILGLIGILVIPIPDLWYYRICAPWLSSMYVLEFINSTGTGGNISVVLGLASHTSGDICTRGCGDIAGTDSSKSHSELLCNSTRQSALHRNGISISGSNRRPHCWPSIQGQYKWSRHASISPDST